MTFQFMTDGIPIVYYGQEQLFSGGVDPYNREALWPSEYANTTAYQLITRLNKLRSWMIKTDEENYLRVGNGTNVLAVTREAMAVVKGSVISIVTSIGSPVCGSFLFRGARADSGISLRISVLRYLPLMNAMWLRWSMSPVFCSA